MRHPCAIAKRIAFAPTPVVLCRRGPPGVLTLAHAAEIPQEEGRDLGRCPFDDRRESHASLADGDASARELPSPAGRSCGIVWTR